MPLHLNLAVSLCKSAGLCVFVQLNVYACVNDMKTPTHVCVHVQVCDVCILVYVCVCADISTDC